MSDALLTEISGKLTQILGALSSGAAAAPKAAATNTDTKTADTKAADTKAAAAAKAKAADDAKKAAAAKATAATAAAKPAAAAGPAAGTKGPGGKFSIDQVREKIREVAANPNLGKQSAKDILDQDGGGVTRVLDLKPENYDKVYEAASVALQTDGGKQPTPPAPEDDLM